MVALAGFSSLRSPPTVSADTVKFYLECPKTWVREGDSVDVFLVRETPYQNDAGFNAYWHTEEGTAHGIFDFVAEDSVQQGTTADEEAANRMKHTVRTKDGIVVEREEVFTVSFTPVVNVADSNGPARDNRCEITIVVDDFHVTGIEVISSPSKRDTYGLGETIEFAVNFSHEVEVQGHVVLGFWIDGKWQGATYRSGSGSNRLVFGYEVQPEDSDSDGISVSDGYMEANGTRHGIGGSGVISEPNSTGAQVAPWYTGISDQPQHKVDGSRAPRPLLLTIFFPDDGNTYQAGEEIILDIEFTAPVKAIDTPLASLWFDGTGKSEWRGARYQSGSGTDTLRFSYEVSPGDLDTDGLLIGAKDHQGMGENKIKALHHDVNAVHTHHEWFPGYKVNGKIHVTDVSMASSPFSGDTYRFGETIKVDVTFSVAVRALFNPFIGLWLDGTERSQARVAQYTGGSGTRTLRFSYEVWPGDLDTDGLLVGAVGQQGMGMGKIKALNHDWDADHSFRGRQFEGHKVLGNIYVTDVSMVSRPASGDTYRYGENIEVDVTFNDPVRALDTPHVSLWFDGTGESLWRGARYQSGSGSEILRFSYEVSAEDKDTDGILIGAIDAQGLGEGKVQVLYHDLDVNHAFGARFLEGHKVNGQP